MEDLKSTCSHCEADIGDCFTTYKNLLFCNIMCATIYCIDKYSNTAKELNVIKKKYTALMNDVESLKKTIKELSDD